MATWGLNCLEVLSLSFRDSLYQIFKEILAEAIWFMPSCFPKIVLWAKGACIHAFLEPQGTAEEFDSWHVEISYDQRV